MATDNAAAAAGNQMRRQYAEVDAKISKVTTSTTPMATMATTMPTLATTGASGHPSDIGGFLPESGRSGNAPVATVTATTTATATVATGLACGNGTRFLPSCCIQSGAGVTQSTLQQRQTPFLQPPTSLHLPGTIQKSIGTILSPNGLAKTKDSHPPYQQQQWWMQTGVGVGVGGSGSGSGGGGGGASSSNNSNSSCINNRTIAINNNNNNSSCSGSGINNDGYGAAGATANSNLMHSLNAAPATAPITGSGDSALISSFDQSRSATTELIYLNEDVTNIAAAAVATAAMATATATLKRDDFLKATKKICLVVSPPLNKLQIKSRSLTHLDTMQISNTYPDGDAMAGQHDEFNSGDYIFVYFDIMRVIEKEEWIPAHKGITLVTALKSSLDRRSLSLSQIIIADREFVKYSSDNNGGIVESFAANLIDEFTEASSLAGRTLIVSERETFRRAPHPQLQKAASVGSQGKTAKFYSNTPSDEFYEAGMVTTMTANMHENSGFYSNSNQFKSGTSGSVCATNTAATAAVTVGKQPKQRWSAIFGIKSQQQSQLCDILDNYAKNGVPRGRGSFASSLTTNADWRQALDFLDNLNNTTWTEFVTCSETEMKIQSAIWELVTTEIDYIHALQTVKDLFLACLEGIQSYFILTEVDQNKLFSNIREICEVHLQFWTCFLFPMVNHSMQTSHPMCIDYFKQGFLQFATLFAPYMKYCAEQSTCQFYCKEQNLNNPLFTAYLAWCESQKKCNRLRLADILVRPMQRLTKYSLLLTAIRKHVSNESDVETMDAMIHSVEDFVCSVNSHLSTRQENERLKGIMARIDTYDVVDSSNDHLDKMIKQYSFMMDLCAPIRGCPANQGRYLFMEGDLKFKDNFGKMDVHCFLLTDILLVCKPFSKKGHGMLKVIRQPFLTDRLVIKLKENILCCVLLNEFNIAIAAFTLQCTEAKSWHDAITKAKHIYTRLKQGTNTNWETTSPAMAMATTMMTTNGVNCKHSYGSGSTAIMDPLTFKKSPLTSSFGSRMSSLNNSHSGSVELNESRNPSIDNEKTNSLSSEEGSLFGVSLKKKNPSGASSSGGGVGGVGSVGGGGGSVGVPVPQPTRKIKTPTTNSLIVQPFSSNLGQSMPNLNLNPSQASNTLLVPGTSATSSGHSNLLLSPCHRGISYPPPSPTRATLRRGLAFSLSTKNPPLVKTRNVTSQNSFIWNQPQIKSSSPQALSPVHQQQQQPQQPQQSNSRDNISPTNSRNESDV